MWPGSTSHLVPWDLGLPMSIPVVTEIFLVQLENKFQLWGSSEPLVCHLLSLHGFVLDVLIANINWAFTVS